MIGLSSNHYEKKAIVGSKLKSFRMRKWRIILPAFGLFASLASEAQDTDTRGWLFWSNTLKLSKKWDFRSDAQLRSTASLEQIATLLLRGMFSYKFNDLHSAGLGYVYKPDWDHSTGKAVIQPEHRVFEQYLLNTNAGKSEFTGRFRLEQRLVKETTDYKFSQRIRGFLGFQIPLVANTDFSKGLYAMVQNELFLNVQNKENVNNDAFDQNRAQAGLGYRWSKKVDTDFSYMHWRQNEKDGNRTSHVFVLMVTTEL